MLSPSWPHVITVEADQRRPRGAHKTHNTAAVAITLPETEAEERLDYLDQYSCRPPPLVRQSSCLKRVKLWGQIARCTFR